MSITSPNIRPPCGQTSGSPPVKIFGGCDSRQYFPTQSIKVLKNVTQVKNYANPADPPWIDPYARPEEYTAPNCSPYRDYECGDGINGNYYCGVPDPTTDIKPASGDSHSFDVGAFHNLYAHTDQTISYENCRPGAYGFKNVYASKHWMGRKSYTSKEHTEFWDDFDWCCQCGYHQMAGTSDTVKYTGMSAVATITENRSDWFLMYNGIGGTCTCNDCITHDCSAGVSFIELASWTDTAYANNTIHTDRYKGNLYVDSCYSSSAVTDCRTNGSATCIDGCNPSPWCQCECGCPTYTFDGTTTYCSCDTDPDPADCRNRYYTGPWAAYAWSLLGLANNNVSWVQSLFCGAQANMPYPDVITGGGNSWTLKWYTTRTEVPWCSPAIDTQFLLREATVTPTSVRIKDYGENGGRAAMQPVCNGYYVQWTLTRDLQVTFGSSTFHYVDWTLLNNSYSFEGDRTEEVIGTLTGLYTPQQAYDDAVALLAYWDMGDDEMLPWRTDTSVNKGPWVHYDENPVGLSIPTCTPNTSSLGEIYGKPAPQGIDRVWNPRHENYCTCIDIYGCETVFLKDYGAWSDSSLGVPRATEWIDDRYANGMPQGAFAMVNQFDTTPGTCNSSGPHRMFDDNIFLCKYAEVIHPKKSINFGRPCGEDRLQISESSERCIESVVDNVVTIESYWGSYPPLPDWPTKWWVCGTGTVDGLWEGTRDSDYQLTLTTLLVSASLLPFSPIEDCGTGMVAGLRWEDKVPGICGRTRLLSATNSQPVTCSIEDESVLMDDDYVIIRDAKGPGVNGTWQITVISPTTFALNGSSGSAYTGSGVVYSPWSKDWMWYDDLEKGDYTALTWKYNFRDWGEWFRYSSSIAWNAGTLNCQYGLDSYGCCGTEAEPCEGYPPCPDPAGYYCTAPWALPAEPRPNNWQCGFEPAITEIKCEDACLPVSRCSPKVAYFAPPGQDNFKGANKNHGFGVIVADSQGWNYYGWEMGGAKWQGIIKQAIPDPFWQRPPCPCTYIGDWDLYDCDCSMRMDDGTCKADEYDPCIKYYPLYPQVEARCKEPTGAPPLAPIAYLGCADITEFVSGSPCPNNLCYPPWASMIDWAPAYSCPAYKPHVYATPWVDIMNKTNCVCNDGRFAEEYKKQGVSCNDTDIVPPP